MDTNRIIVVANTNEKYKASNRVLQADGICPTLLARDYKGPKLIAIKSEVSREHKS